MNPTLLYPGDNGAHRFYESEDSRSFIFRNHGEKQWMAHHDNRGLEDYPRLRELQKERPNLIAVMLSDPTIKGLLAKVKEHFDLDFATSKKKVWVPGRRENSNMKLVPYSQRRPSK